MLARAYKCTYGDAERGESDRKKLEEIESKGDTRKILYETLKGTSEPTPQHSVLAKLAKDASIFIEKQCNNGDFKLFDALHLRQDKIIGILKEASKGTLVLIDYIQRMPDDEADRRYDGYMRMKKIMANLVNVTVEKELVTICGAQFNRVAGKDDKGNDTFTDTSFRESGDIEQDAHNAIGIGWEREEKKEPKIFCEILKARESAGVGKRYNLEFNGAYSFMKKGDNIGMEEVEKDNKETETKKSKVKPGAPPEHMKKLMNRNKRQGQ
ncbi:MAG: hypothetical protein Nk1A_6540 [Endomicrobiia bacterium]|nr:MAG: hypothetical protein Nk1A_6540 [Endomicrobiia bacterium]